MRVCDVRASSAFLIDAMESDSHPHQMQEVRYLESGCKLRAQS